jgi:hypothetical protein
VIKHQPKARRHLGKFRKNTWKDKNMMMMILKIDNYMKLFMKVKLCVLICIRHIQFCSHDQIASFKVTAKSYNIVTQRSPSE